MTDWSKLKVADLKAALKKRGLPQTGLKPALVARLTDADIQIQDGSESEATLQDDDKHDASSAASPDTDTTALPPSGLSAELLLDEPPAEPQLESPGRIEPASSGHAQESNDPIPQIESVPAQSPGVVPPSQPSEHPDNHAATPPSVPPQEAIEDRLKRKRRSQSPAISSEDAARKRFKDASHREVERLIPTQNDAEWAEKNKSADGEIINAEASEVETEESVLPLTSVVDAPKEEAFAEYPVPVSNQDTTQMDVDDLEESKPDKIGTANTQSFDDPSKGRDSRFTTLFTKPPPSEAFEAPPDLMEYEADRIISPARHPATSALYIRDLLRPLNSAQLRSHLATLATPPHQDTDSDVILNLYIDSIKSHAFVLFSNISAASRVRNALHDRIWPDEKTRKPLWVDFIPVEKAEEWIAQELASSSGSRALAKKWEVNYSEDEDHRVTATLQEISAIPRQIHPIRQPSGPGQAQPPTASRDFAPPAGPRGFVNQSQTVATTVARLDKLFDSTTTKPVLYYKPVSKEVANKRLSNIDAALSKDAAAGRRITGESHRFTFEDRDVLVDRGPEIFSGIRPPPNYRGSRAGRGNAFRPRGGYDRDRGGHDRRYESYRGDRRGSRDDRPY